MLWLWVRALRLGMPPGQMWKYEGNKTLQYYLKRRDTLRALSQDLRVPEEAVVATVMKQLFEGLAVRPQALLPPLSNTYPFALMAHSRHCCMQTACSLCSLPPSPLPWCWLCNGTAPHHSGPMPC